MAEDPRLGHGFAPGRHQIDSYGQGGFRFAGMSHKGSILALPSGIVAWRVASARELTPADLEPALSEVPRIDFLLVGTGLEIVPLPPELRRPFREAGISVDAMQTGAAARTYNVLVAENRRVGAALIAV
ncbi:MTH938/NDUFAF3 family protein [Enterovirga aerilata]|uniref:Mth938-like domain-containing protein n=1 Tax=Enterovirga aerilata TaxID=2730920 RepID=A0A849I463_9HYPH|nr:hypothetical protein [Enterovirga sp. DB1703]